ncbi:MAG: response regulator transcription factor [Bacteroidales bacterium]|nr:MAG: response regulator transcription factor [Bacteroidales bacterium]
MNEKVRILIADDHEIFRKGLKVILSRLKYVDIIGEAENGNEVINIVNEQQVDIVLMDIEMSEMNGIEATRNILSIKPEVKIVALTMFNDEQYIQDMLDAGAKGFLLKNITKQILDKAIRTIAEGNNYYSDELFSFFTRKVAGEKSSKDIELKLTKREKEILQLICEGLSNEEIADKLSISQRTVIGHKSNLLAKTNCKNTPVLISYSIKNQLVKI